MTISPSDPTPTPEQASKSTNPLTIVLIIAGVGCGCLSVVIVIGILAAIALPSFLNSASKAKESEARNNVGSIVRGQQAYLLEKSTFASTIDELGLGVPTETTNYIYAAELQPDGNSVYVTARGKDDTLKGFSAGVFRLASDRVETVEVVCESDQPADGPPAMPTFDPTSQTAVCPEGSSAL